MLSHRKLDKPHDQILLVRREIRKSFVVMEEQEEIAYRRYAESLSRLENLTCRFPEVFMRYTTELRLFRLSIFALQKNNAQSYTPEQCLLQPTFSTVVLLPGNKTRLKLTTSDKILEVVEMLQVLPSNILCFLPFPIDLSV
jgi:hypothetical protein